MISAEAINYIYIKHIYDYVKCTQNIWLCKNYVLYLHP